MKIINQIKMNMNIFTQFLERSPIKKYRLLVEGENVLFKDDSGELKKHGFFTYRYVRAKNIDEAVQLAIKLVQKELSDYTLNEKADQPLVFVKESTELVSFKNASVPGKGFSWYEEDNSN